MEWGLVFFLNSFLLGIGLAMDAFSVSLANGLHEPGLKKGRMCFIAGVYAFFQFLMPLTGWLCVHTIIEYFSRFTVLLPWISLVLLLFIGIKMLLEAAGSADRDEGSRTLGTGTLLMQGIATSIDALSTGFAIADYPLAAALVAAAIIAAVTFAICTAGLAIGKKAGTSLSAKASVLGGIILILIGIEIFIKGVFF